MVKEKRILSYFISWLVLGFIICFIGINNTYAATYYLNYQYKQQYYDNLGSSVNAISTTWNESLQSYVSGNITTVANSYGAGLSISSPIPIISNHTYSISIYFDDISNVAVSSKSNIAISTSLDGAAHNYASNQFWANTIQSNVNNNRILQFVFTANGGASFIFIPWTTTSRVTQSYVTTQIVMEDLGSEGISQNDINNSLNNQTNELNNSINNSTNTITGSITNSQNNINQNIDDMEQSIIDSNKETQNVIKDQFNSCRPSINLYNKDNNIEKYFYNSSGYRESSQYYFNNQRIYNIENIITISFSRIVGNAFIRLIEYNSENIMINRVVINNSPIKIQLNNNTSYILVSVNSDENDGYFEDLQIQNGNSETKYEPYGEEICTNKLDEQNDKLDEIQGALTDNSTPNTSGLKNSAGWLPAGPLDSVLNLPLSLFNALTTNLNKTCNPINIPLPYVNKNITLPCINTLYNQIGVTSFLSWIGVIVSGLMLYTYLLKLYKWIEDRISLNETHNVDSWGGL